MRVLVLGVTGTIGYAVWHTLQNHLKYEVWGTLRNEHALTYFPTYSHPKLVHGIDVLHQDKLLYVFEKIRPDIVINGTGLIKQLSIANDPVAVLPINAIFPHQLATICSLSNARLIQISTDCVFSGNKGNYAESDVSDADDLYGKSKYIGEIHHLPHVVTLRTSTIGHELHTQYALLDWFLAQKDKVKGYTNAIYSGVPTFELARVIRDYVLPNTELTGLYHIASKPINKYELLKLIAEKYGKKINIEPDARVNIDRSLCALRFKEQTGYFPAEWPILIDQMYQSRQLVRTV